MRHRPFLVLAASWLASAGCAADPDPEPVEPEVPVPVDACRPASPGAPEVILGTGQTDYANLEDGAVVRLEKGPQGGHHVWVAARMKNLRQTGSVATVTGSLENDPAPIAPMSFVFGFDRDEGAFCKIWGLRFQVDSGMDLATAYRRFLGKALTITVTVKDSTGASASATKTIRLADEVLCPDGTSSCSPR